MNIGQAARAAGLSAKMIRYYESIALLPQAHRSHNGYRRYGEDDVQRLSFIRQARELGFSLEKISELLSLWDDDARASREVRALANSHIAELERRIAQMQAMVAALQHLVQRCPGDEGADCAILDTLAGSSTSSSRS